MVRTGRDVEGRTLGGKQVGQGVLVEHGIGLVSEETPLVVVVNECA